MTATAGADFTKDPEKEKLDEAIWKLAPKHLEVNMCRLDHKCMDLAMEAVMGSLAPMLGNDSSGYYDPSMMNFNMFRQSKCANEADSWKQLLQSTDTSLCSEICCEAACQPELMMAADKMPKLLRGSEEATNESREIRQQKLKARRAMKK